MYSYTLSLTLALDGVAGQRHDLAALPPVKTPYPLYRSPGGPRVDLDGYGEEKIPCLHRGSRSRRPGRSESLNRLGYSVRSRLHI